MKKKKHKPGFTLLELMVVVAIIGVLAGIAIPSAVYFLPNYRLNTSAKILVSHLQAAKMAAIKNNANCLVVFNSGAYRPEGAVGDFTVYLDTDRDWKTTDSGGNPERTIVTTTTMPKGVSLYNANFTNNGSGEPSATTTVGFDTKGLAARSVAGNFVYGQVYLRNSRNRYVRISVSPAGNVKLEKSENGVNWN